MRLDQIQAQADRLLLYAQRATDKIKLCKRSSLLDAMPDLAETGEIARRLYKAVEELLKRRAQLKQRENLA
jgi:hypothetical protein